MCVGVQRSDSYIIQFGSDINCITLRTHIILSNTHMHTHTPTNEIEGFSEVLREFLSSSVGDCDPLVHKPRPLVLLVVVGTLCGHVEYVLHSKLQ